MKLEDGKITEVNKKPIIENPIEEIDDEREATPQQLIDACEQCIINIEKENSIETLKKATILLLKIIAVELNNKIEYNIQEKYYT